MYRPALALAALAALAAPLAGQPPAYRLEVTDAQQVSATVTYELRAATYTVTKWMVFLPDPPDLPAQARTKFATTPATKAVTEKGPLARKVRYAEVVPAKPGPGGKLVLKMEIGATLRARELVELAPGERPPAVPPLTAAERKLYLAAGTRIDHTAEAFRDWLDAKKLRRDRAESAVAFAARVVETVRTDFTYHFDPTADKRASVACRAGKTDCAGMAFVFVAALRANDVPARALVGRRALPREPDSAPGQLGYDRPHVRAEFFVPNVGWVPADPSDALVGKGRPVREFVGRDAGDLLVFHVDADLQLPFPDKVRETPFLQIGPYYWAQGTGAFDATFGPTGWDLKATPAAQK